MRKRLAIVGHSEEGLALIPLLEANPDVEVCAILTTDPGAAAGVLSALEPRLGESFRDRMTSDAEAVLRTRGLVALVEADPAEPLRSILADAPDRGIQVTTPLIARLLYAFGPVDASRKPELLHSLSEILESYNLTVDRRGLLSRILQIAVGATGADRGSLMLLDPETGNLAVEVAIGIEREVLPKIRIAPGEGIAGRAFESREAILLHGKADQERYSVVRERHDVESAISAPLVYEGHALGVLNISHGRQRGAFDEEDRRFVEQLAAMDAKIIARADEYHALQRDSTQLRAQEEVRRLLSGGESLARRLAAICSFVSGELENGLCHLYLHDPEMDRMVLQSSSAQLDPLAAPIRLGRDAGIHGWVMRSRKPVVLSETFDGQCRCFAIVPLIARDELLGLLSLESVLTRHGSEFVRDKIAAVASALSSELYDSVREARMEREATKMTAITETAALMNSAEDSAELHRRITSSAAMILDAEHVVLRLRDEASGRFQIRSYFGSAETDGQSPLFAFEKELSIEAIRQQQPLRLVDVSQRPELAEQDAGVASALIQPLAVGGRVMGTLSLLGKVTQDALSAQHFTREDESILAHFAQHARHALEQVHARESARHQRRFDDLTGLPNAAHLRERLEQEIVRSSGHGRQLLLIRLQIAGLSDLLSSQQEAEGDRLVLSLAQELRAVLREFDVLARTAPDSFEMLIPEPDEDVSSLLGPLARRAHEAIRREPDASLRDHLSLQFGYALHPDDGQTTKQLQDRARELRIMSD